MLKTVPQRWVEQMYSQSLKCSLVLTNAAMQAHSLASIVQWTRAGVYDPLQPSAMMDLVLMGEEGLQNSSVRHTHTHTLTQLSGPGVLHFLLLSTAASRNTECVIYVLNYSRKQQAAGQEVETNQCLGRSACRLTCTCSLIQTLFWTL